MSDHFSFDALNQGDTEKLGAALAQTVTAGTIVGLIGTLGSGKTKLVQSIAIARGVDPQSVVSPTYVILHEYPGPITIFHFDLYRVADDDEWDELGADEILEQGGIALIEWADRFRNRMPADWLEIQIEVVSETARRFSFQMHGAKGVVFFDTLQQKLST